MVWPSVRQKFVEEKSSMFIISHSYYVKDRKKQNVSPNLHNLGSFLLFKHLISPLFTRFPKLPIRVELYLSYTGKLPLSQRKFV